MYADAATSCGAGCSSTYITNQITVLNTNYPTSATTWGPNNPCAISGGVGWASAACSTTWCPIASVPSDFQWSYAYIEIPSSFIWGLSVPLQVCRVQPTCSPASGTTDGPYTAAPPAYPWNIVAKWTSSGGNLSDVTISVDQYP